MPIATINPATGETLATFPAHTPEEVEALLVRADEANRHLAATSFAQRADWMVRAAELLEAELDELAALVSLEMGKTIGSARYEVAKSARGMRWYAEHAEQYLAEEFPVSPADVGASRVGVRYQPLGTVLAVMPWNYPFWQVMRFAAPALMAGNTGVLKHASSVPQCALYLGSLFERGGFPVGAFQTVLLEGAAVAPLLDDRRIRAVTLTGSVGAGASIAAAAGRNVKKSVLELGGADVFVVMPSADVDRAVEAGVNARLQNSGQSCIAAKRFYVHEDVAAQYREAFVARMLTQVTGDPLDEAVDFGPLATEQGRADAHALVEDARAKGATVLAGGELPDGPGWFYPATVLTGVTPEMRIFREECFGPVACLFTVSSAAEAIELANDSDFGLSSSVWTNDLAEIEAFEAGIEAGGVFVNGLTASFPQLPFGGVKDSGYGRELSELGIREFTNIKTVWRA